LVLIGVAVLGTVIVWQRRSAMAVWWIGGNAVGLRDSTEVATQVVRLLPDRIEDSRQAQKLSLWITRHWVPADKNVFFVGLDGCQFDDGWLWHLRGFPNLQGLSLRPCQVAQGIEQLRELTNLRNVLVRSASSNGDLQALLHLPQLDELTLMEVAGPVSGLEELGAHPNIKRLTVFGDYYHPSSILHQLTTWVHLEELSVASRDDSFDDGLQSLIELPRLRRLNLCNLRMSDRGMRWVSRMESLEEFCFTSIDPPCGLTEAGWQELQHMPRLKTIRIHREGIWSSALEERLRQLLPQCKINWTR
jgi:hypothetical protein